MTREEAIEILEEVRTIDDSMYQYNEKYLQALDMALKALEQTDVLDQIRAEVASISPKTYPFYDHMDDYVKMKDVLKIIDKYRKEQT